MVVFANTLYSQNINEQIEFRLDNDKFFFIDRYYTSGLFIGYKKQLDNDFLFKKKEGEKLQLNLFIGNETYTPTDLSSLDASRFDRPFAGWLFLSAGVNKLRENSLLSWDLEGGITGRASLAGLIQQGFHDLFDLGNRPTWIEEINFKVLFNLKFKYLYNLQLDDKNVFEFQVEPTLGTKDIFIENGVRYTFGKINSFNHSSRIGAIDSSLTNEFYGLLGIAHRYVIHNTILQGGITRNETSFTVSPTRNIFKLEAGAVLKRKRNTFKLILNFNTRESAIATSHRFGSIIYARSF